MRHVVLVDDVGAHRGKAGEFDDRAIISANTMPKNSAVLTLTLMSSPNTIRPSAIATAGSITFIAGNDVCKSPAPNPRCWATIAPGAIMSNTYSWGG